MGVYSVEERRSRFLAGVAWERWGSLWIGGVEYEAKYTAYRVVVAAYAAGGGPSLWREEFRGLEVRDDIERKGSVAMGKYIQAARARRKASASDVTVDPIVGKDRPALVEFLSSVEGPDKGSVRERSVLMIAFSEDGCRVGIKDDDLGGWAWRQGEGFQEALDGLEKALVDGTARFGGGGSRKRPKGK